MIGFYLCGPRRRKINGTIFGSFLKDRKMAPVIEVSCSEPPFDNFVFSFGFIIYNKFAQVLIILNGLPVLLFNWCLVDSK